MDPNQKVTLTITHWNRFPMLVECVAGVRSDPRIGEIVISDDASTDGSWEQMQEFFKHNDKVKLFRNETNLDCYRNKAEALRRSQGWCILFDSDNIITADYLNVLYALPVWDAKMAYCPDFAEPEFDYRSFAGMTFDLRNISLHALDRRFRCALNTANYFMHRDDYLEVWDGTVDPHTADSIYQNYNWIKSGRRLHIVKGLRYRHRVHDQSHYKLNIGKTGRFHQEVEMKLLQLKPQKSR